MSSKNVLPLKNAGNALIILKNSERHHSISKSHHSSTYIRFKGIFVHQTTFSQESFFIKYSTLSYLSIATWITQFRYLWMKLSPKQENCSNLKNCNSWNFWRLMTREALTSRDRKEDGWLVKLLDDSWTLDPSSNKSKTPF